MRSKVILLLMAFVMIFMLVGCGLVYGGTLGERVTLTETLAFDEVEEITIDVSSATVNVIKDDRDDIYVVFETYENGDKLRTYEGENTQIETYNANKLMFFSINTQYRLDIYIPEEFDEDISISLSSGDFTLNDFELNDVDVTLSSGNLNFTNVETENLDLRLSSGDVNFDEVKTGYLTVDMSSGDLNLMDFTGAIDGEMSSGSFYVNYVEQMDDLNFEASSGTIKVDYSDVSVNASFDLKKTSGNFNVGIGLDDYNADDDGDRVRGKVGTGESVVSIKISSGNIIIQ